MDRRVAALLLAGLVLGCRTPVREPPPPIRGAPAIETGFYTVHKVRDGKLDEAPTQGLFGPVLFLGSLEYVDRPLLTGSATARFEGVRGAFLPHGEIRSVLHEGRVKHKWVRDEQYEGTLEFLEPGPDARPGDLRVRVREERNAVELVLRFLAKRIATESLKTVFLAHRGSYFGNVPPLNPDGIYPANTVEAFEAALRSGYRGFELDVRLTRDRQFVVSHDDDLSVSTDFDVRISESTLADLDGCMVLKSAGIPEKRLASFKAYIAAPLPSLREVLVRYLPDERVDYLVVDIKPATDIDIAVGIGNALGSLARSRHAGKLIFLTHSKGVVMALKSTLPRARFALEGDVGAEPVGTPAEFIPELAGEPGGPHDMISMGMILLTNIFHPRGSRDLAELFRNAAMHDYAILGWTVSDENRLEILRKKGLLPEFLLTDAPYSRIARQRLLAFDASTLGAE